jgi:small-conductance mechanosensitive channel
MNRIFTTAAAAALMTVGTAYAQTGALDQATAPTAKNAQGTLKVIEKQSADIANNAFLMNQAVDRTDDTEYQSDLLAQLRAEVNQVGRELGVLEAERGSLPQWEAAAVDQVMPAMDAVAMESTEAIHTFDADRAKLYASNYAIETDEISKDADRAATLLHNDIKLAKVKGTETRLTTSVDEQRVPGTQPVFQGAAE